MKVIKILRNGMAGALIAAVPVTASVAATRPSAAVPMAGSAVAAQDDDDDRVAGAYVPGKSIAWPAVAIIVAALILAIWIAVDDDDDGEGSLSAA